MSTPQAAPDGAASLPRSGRAARKLLALAVGLLLALLLVEGAFRIDAWRRGAPYSAARARTAVDALVARTAGLAFVPRADSESDVPLTAGLALHPYGGFQSTEAWSGIEELRAYFASDQGRATYDVMLFGGSVAAEFSHWTRRLFAPELARDPRLASRPIRFFSRACPGLKQPQLATDLEWMLSLGMRPDAVLLLDGFNELALAADNASIGVHPLFPSYWEMQASLSGPVGDPAQLALLVEIHVLRRDAAELAGRARRFGLLRSAVLGRLVLRELAQLEARVDGVSARLREHAERAQPERPLGLRGPDFAGDETAVLELAVRAWAEGSRSMQAVCRARGIHFVHVLQPAARDQGSKPLSAEELASLRDSGTWRTSIEQGYPRLRAAGAELAREGVNFHDGSGMFAGHPETIYADMCHFGEAGCTLLARFAGRALLESWPKE